MRTAQWSTTVLSKSDICQNSEARLFESPRDRARFKTSAGFGGIEIMDARFVDHSFAPHVHDELMIGIMHQGIKRFQRERKTHLVGKYGLSINNAGDLHTGERADGPSILYSAIYLPMNVLEMLGVSSEFAFTSAVLEDRDVWMHLASATAMPTDTMLFEEQISTGIGIAIDRYGGLASRVEKVSPKIRLAQDFIQSHHTEPIGLTELADLCSLSVRQVIRAFKAQYRVTPHQYLTSLRIQSARKMLKTGHSLAGTAVAVGFADQPHFSKTFRSIMGTTPGNYRAAVSG